MKQIFWSVITFSILTTGCAPTASDLREYSPYTEAKSALTHTSVIFINAADPYLFMLDRDELSADIDKTLSIAQLANQQWQKTIATQSYFPTPEQQTAYDDATKRYREHYYGSSPEYKDNGYKENLKAPYTPGFKLGDFNDQESNAENTEEAQGADHEGEPQFFQDFKENFLLFEIRNLIAEQIQFSMSALGAYGAAVANNRVTITSLKVESIEDPFTLKVTYSSKASVHFPNDKALPEKAVVFVPARVDYESIDLIYRLFSSCVPPEKQADVYSDNFFRYFDPSYCKDFEQLNRDQLVSKVEIQFQEILDQSDGGKPEYDRIWEDKRFVVTYVFGSGVSIFNDEGVMIDLGRKGFEQMKDYLDDGSLFETISKTDFGDNVVRRTLKYIGPSKLENDVGANFTREIDLVAVYLKEKSIDSNWLNVLGQNLAEMEAAKRRLASGDFFSYNGHAGYGMNTDEIESSFVPDKNQYMIFSFNGCNTYVYSSLINPNFDIISNSVTGYGTNFPRITQGLLLGLIKGEAYPTLMQVIPRSQMPIVVNEDVKSRCTGEPRYTRERIVPVIYTNNHRTRTTPAP